MRAVRAVRDDDFVDIVLGAAAPVVVGCAESWTSGPPHLADFLDRLARDHDWLVVARLDVVRSPRTATAYRVTDGPALLLFQAGRLVANLPGVPTAEAVARAFGRPGTPSALPARSATVDP
jgi:thioredoxin 1